MVPPLIVSGLCILLVLPNLQASETTTLSTTLTTNTTSDPLSGQSSDVTETSSRKYDDTLQVTASFQSSRRTPSHDPKQATYRDDPKAQEMVNAAEAGGKENYDPSEMIQTPSHFTFVSNQQLSPGHVTVLGYTTPIVKAGGYIRVSEAEGAKSTSPTPAPVSPSLHNVQPLALSPPGENTLNDIQSQLLQYTSNSIYSMSEAQHKLQQQQMAKLIESAALAAEKAPLRGGLQGLVNANPQQPSSLSFYRLQPGETAQPGKADSHELADDFPSKMNYKNYEQHTRLPYRVQSEEDAKSAGAFAAPLDKPKPFLVYKPGYEKVSAVESQGGFQPVLPNSYLGHKPLTMIADKGITLDLNGNEITSGLAPPTPYINQDLTRMHSKAELYSQHPHVKTSFKNAENYDGLPLGKSPLELNSYSPKALPAAAHYPSQQTALPPPPPSHHHYHHHHHANAQLHHLSRPYEPQPSSQPSLDFNTFAHSHPPKHPQFESARSPALPMQSPSHEEIGSGSKYDPKAELLNQINLMLTNSPNLSEESRGKHRNTIDSTLKQVEEAFGGGAKLARFKMGMSSTSGPFGRYREMYTQEEPVRLVGTVAKLYPEQNQHQTGLASPPGPPAPAYQQAYLPPPRPQALVAQARPPQPYGLAPLNPSVKYDEVSADLYQPEYQAPLKSNRLQQKIQQFVNEQILAEEERRGAARLAPQFLAGTPQAAYMQKHSQVGKLQMVAPAPPTPPSMMNPNLLDQHPPQSPTGMSRYTLARELGQIPSGLASSPSTSAYATYYSQQRLAPSSPAQPAQPQSSAGNPYRSLPQASQLAPLKTVRSSSEWWNETSGEALL